MSSLFAATLAFALAGASPKVAVAPFSGGEGVKAAELKSLGEMLAAELRRTPQWQVMTYGELEAVLTHEQLNQLVGCGSSDCYAGLDQAGVTLLGTGSLGKIGQSFMLSLKLIDVPNVKVIATADRRVKGSLDDVLDALPIAAKELVEHGSKLLAAKAADVPVAAPPAPTGTASTMPAAHAQVPLADKTVAARLRWLRDDRGRLVAFEDKKEPASSREVFAGDDKGVFRQRIIGGGAEGMEAWSVTFWEPRVQSRWQGGLDFRAGKYALQCGDNKVALTEVTGADAAGLAKKVPLFEVRWQRQALFIGRDDEGNYYYVDQLRDRPDAPEHRLFVGPKKRPRQLTIDDVVNDSAGVIIMTSEGRLIVREPNADVPKMAWAIGKSEQPLTGLDLFAQAKVIYTDLGPYVGQPLGTPCDATLGK